jgi:hypothetical protein
LIIPIDLKPLKVTMPTTTPTILDQISAEKTKISERLARLDTDRAAVATRLTDLETAERVLTRVSKTPPARRTTACAAKFCNSAIRLSEAGVPPHPGAHRAAKSAPLGGGAQPPGGRRRAFCPPGRGDGLRRSSSPLAWGKYERVVRVSRRRRDEIKSYALVPR